jgi:hypothetical protein
VLRRIFGPKRDEVTGGWGKLHNEELHNLYSSSSIIRMSKSRAMRWTGHVTRMRKKGNAYRILVGKPEGKSPPGRPGRRCEDNIKWIGWGEMDWIDLAQDRDTVMNCNPEWHQVPADVPRQLVGNTTKASMRIATRESNPEPYKY